MSAGILNDRYFSFVKSCAHMSGKQIITQIGTYSIQERQNNMFHFEELEAEVAEVGQSCT